MFGYWIAFRLESDSGWKTRYGALIDALKGVSSNSWWDEPTSFLLFESSVGIDAIAQRVRQAVDARKDVVLIGMTDYKSARLIGNNLQSYTVFKMMPYAQYA